MSFLLDTNVVSEWVKPHPNVGVIAWLAEADEDTVFLSVVTLAELRYGIERLPAGRRRTRLAEWLRDDIPLRFEGRILPIDVVVADACGKLMARIELGGQTIAAMDALIAATTEVHHLALVTRNTSHFDSAVAAMVNPWTQDA